MNTARLLSWHRRRISNQIVFACLLLSLLIQFGAAQDSTPPPASNPDAQQWSELGDVAFRDNYELKRLWTSSPDSRAQGKYWRDSYYLPEDERQYSPWEPTVKDEVAPVKGQITVRGPGVFAIYGSGKGGATVALIDRETKRRLYPSYHFFRKTGDRWQSQWSARPNNQEDTLRPQHFSPHGRIHDNEEHTIDVQVLAASYNNAINTGEFAYPAPQELDFEIWYFPMEGGKLIRKLMLFVVYPEDHSFTGHKLVFLDPPRRTSKPPLSKEASIMMPRASRILPGSSGCISRSTAKERDRKCLHVSVRQSMN